MQRSYRPKQIRINLRFDIVRYLYLYYLYGNYKYGGHFMQKKLRFGVLLLAFLLIVAACSKPSDKEESKPKDTEKKESEQTSEVSDLTIALAADPTSLDPHAANDGNSLYVMSTMYDKLVYLNEDLEITPGLAESLEQISDTVWEAKIRKGVKFHDGTELDAETVKANLDRVRDPELASPVSFLFGMIEEVKVIDPSTVQIITSYPFASLPAHLAHPAGNIISKKSIDADNEAVKNGALPFASVNEHPVGTGPFKFESREHGVSTKVVKFDEYWDKEKAKSNSITFKTIPEDFTRIAELQTGGADIIYPVSPVDIGQVEESENGKILQSRSSNLTYLGFNTEKEPFNNKKVRQAISKAINKEDLINGILDGVALPAKGPLAPTVFGYDESIDTLSYDTEEAKKLLAEAGFENGFQTELLIYDTGAMRDAAVFIQSELSKVGIDVQIETLETGAYLDATGQGSTEMFLGAWGTVTLDADYGLFPMFHSSNMGAPGNRSFFKNEEVDKLLQAAREEGDVEKRLAYYKDVQNLLADEAPVAYLYHSELLAGLGEDVKGFWQYPSSIFFLRDTLK